MTPDQIETCIRLAAEAAQYRWARELSEDARRDEAEDARIQARVGFRCDPKAKAVWWTVWEAAFLAALDARATVRLAPAADAYAGPQHKGGVARAARYARAALDAVLAHARKAGGVSPALIVLGDHLTRIEAWAADPAATFLDVSGVAAACDAPGAALPWVVNPHGALNHVARAVATSLPDQWVHHEEQALHAAATVLANLDDLRREARFRALVPEYLARLQGGAP